MDTFSKLELLGAPARFDVSSPTLTRENDDLNSLRGCTKLLLPGGGYINVLKILFTNYCIHDCKYCFNNCKHRKRISFKSHELANLFMTLYKKRYVSGLFLSSAITKNADETMEQMIETVEMLRGEKFNFNGYIHLKVLPGSSYDLIKRGAVVANRMSVNLEAPNKSRFSELISTKDFQSDVIKRLKWLKELKTEEHHINAGHTTQFVVGASDESDKEIIEMSNKLYSVFDLNRAYFSAFEPIRDTPLQDHPATPSIRQHRLYQADWLLRVYGFKLSEVELALDENELLPLDEDPKAIIASKNKGLFPIEINEAGYDELIRVPGIGPTTAKKLINRRKLFGKLNKLSQLKKEGVIIKRALPFIKVQGKYQKSLNDF